MGNEFFFAWEPALIVWIQAHMGSFGKTLSVIFSTMGETLVIVALLSFVYFCYDKKLGQKIGTVVVIGTVVNPLIKNLALRKRPYFVHDEVKCLKPVEKDADLYDVAAQGYSFPSGHAQNSVEVYTSLGVYTKSKALKVIGIAVPLLIGISRFAVGVHYPTDVLAGWTIGLILVIAVPFLEDKIGSNKFHIIVAVLGAAGFFYCRTNDYYTSYGLMIGFFLSVPFEKKYVNFEKADKVWKMIIRIAGALGIFLGLNAVLKLPFSSMFLDSGTMLAFAVRSVRYCIVTFTAMGVYPMLFKKLKF